MKNYQFKYDGCGEIGIGPVDINEPATSFVYTLHNNSLIAEPVITFALILNTYVFNMTFGGLP